MKFGEGSISSFLREPCRVGDPASMTDRDKGGQMMKTLVMAEAALLMGLSKADRVGIEMGRLTGSSRETTRLER